MIEIILRNLATTYYPKGICALYSKKEYIETFEFKNLITKINSTFATIVENNFNGRILDELKKNEELKNIKDLTLESSDRCLSFKVDFFEGQVLYQLCVNLSIIVPYYYVYVLKNKFEAEPYRWLTLPQRDEAVEIGKFGSQIALISDTIEKKFFFNKFPDSLVNTIIQDINYADVELGSFTYFNAFFLDDVNL